MKNCTSERQDICNHYRQNGGDELHYLFVCRYKSVCTSGKNTDAITKHP